MAVSSARYLPAAAVPVGAVIVVTTPAESKVSTIPSALITVAKIHYGEPQPGRLEIVDTYGTTWPLGGNDLIEIVSLS